MNPEFEPPCLVDYLERGLALAPRAATRGELQRFVGLHDRMLSDSPANVVDPQLVLRAGNPGEAGAAVAFILSPFEPEDRERGAPARVVAALYCAGHPPGEPLADALRDGRVTATVAVDNAPSAVWAEDPVEPEQPSH